MGTIIVKIILTIVAILIVTVINGLMHGNESKPVPVVIMILLVAFLIGVWRYKPKRKADDDKHNLNKE